MLHKLLIPVCLLLAATANAQVGITPVKTTENPAESKIDYRLIGSPMPPLVLVTYQDTAKKTESTTSKDDQEVTGRKSKKKEKEADEAKKEHMKPYITNDDVDNNANLLVMMFNPTCSHCEDQTQLMLKNAAIFKRTKWVLLANKGMKPYLHDFVKVFHLSDYPFVYIGTDSAGFNDNAYMYKALPQINIYDHQRKLIKVFNGEIPMDSLEMYIQ